jgi:uncharacterized protein YacL
MVLLGLFSLAGFFFFRSRGWPVLGGLGVGFGAGAIIIYAESKLQGRSGREILAGVLGLTLGLIVALLVGWVVFQIPAVAEYPHKFYVIIAMALILGYLGTVVGISKRGDIRFSSRRHGDGASPKILDTSVIIDGRIADICESHFIEGKLVVPKFILDELQQIADSPDSLKRNRGRRGLEILRRMQLRKDLEVGVDEYDPGSLEEEVDAKLVKLAQERGAMIVTNDFNLNSIAELRGIKVLNVNELANALKPVVLPGEEISVRVMKKGKEPDQGVGYLNDGTMVVVEGGSNLINKTVPVVISSVLQTTVGRMIFARSK